MTVERRTEVVLPRRVAPQPSPTLNRGGDCGPCVLAGVLGMDSPQEVYDRFLDGKPCSLGHGEMQRLLRVGISDGLLDRAIEHPPTWLGASGEYSAWLGAFGWAAERMHEPWFRYIQMAVDAGLYALVQVDFSRTGGEKWGGTDHWALICGARSWLDWGPADKDGCRAGKHIEEVLVSCSASNRDGEWVPARDFLKFRGGFNALLARPAR